MGCAWPDWCYCCLWFFGGGGSECLNVSALNGCAWPDSVDLMCVCVCVCVSNQISTVNMGLAVGWSAVILGYGKKGLRKSLPHSLGETTQRQQQRQQWRRRHYKLKCSRVRSGLLPQHWAPPQLHTITAWASPFALAKTGA
jgi:hypothetical protein